MNAFVRPLEEYKREYDIENQAQRDLAFYLSKMETIPYLEALEYTQKAFQGEAPLYKKKSPEVMFLERINYGDREIRTMALDKYLESLVARELIFSPNGVAYIPPRYVKSILAQYIQVNMDLRKVDKNKMFMHQTRADGYNSRIDSAEDLKARIALMDMQKVEAESRSYYSTLQESRKIKNNSLSGMHASPSTPMYNRSSHSSLTSTCRCATSYANSGNEKFLGGLRHYYVPNMVIFHITVAARHSNLELIAKAIDKFGLVVPDADQCMEIVRYSTRYYWVNDIYEKQIYDYLLKLNREERAAFAFTGDFYHLDKYNSDFVRDFLVKSSKMIEGTHPDPDTVIKNLDDNNKAIATFLSAPVIKGISLSDAKKDKPSAYHTVALTAEHLMGCMEEYKEIVEAFIRQEYLPQSISEFPTSRRHSVPTSDTDSTIFTTQHWVHKYGGEPFKQQAMGIQYIMTYFIAGMTEHTLKMYNANLGVEQHLIPKLSMKNEYIFPTYSLTSLAKHYFAYQAGQEGNVFQKFKTEIKGVNLRSSNAPPFVNEAASNLMKLIMDKQIRNEDIYLEDVIRPVIETERKIVNDIVSGKGSYLLSTRINHHESYSAGTGAPAWKAHEFWNTYFSHKYGEAPEPPYIGTKINMDLKNKTAINAWLNGIEDPIIKKGLTEWVTTEGKNNVKLFRIPKNIIIDKGIPEEFIPAMDIRGIVLGVMKPFYYVLESCGLFTLNKNNTRVISDEYIIDDQNILRLKV